MTRKLLLLISALTFLTIASSAQDNYRPKKKDLSWGVRADGLRMTAWMNPANDKVFVAVRNFSTKKICYCDSQVNNFAIYARKNAASQWQALKFKTPPQEVVILSLCYSITLKPNEEMLSYALQNGVRNKKNYSFSLDLHEYNFPADLSGTVEVKIVQYNVYCNKPKNTVGEVESQTFAIKLPLPRQRKDDGATQQINGSEGETAT